MSIDQVVLIDGKNLLFRHNAVNGNLARGDGFPTGALFGCLNTMIALSKYIPKTPFVWIWDGEGDTWRHKYMRDNSYIYSKRQEASTRGPASHKKIGYKANRIKPKRNYGDHKSKWPEDSKSRGLIQIPVLRMALDGSGFRSYQINDLEADDLIAIIARHIVRHTSMRVIIHSGDKDFYQLMGKRIKILSRIENGKPLFVDAKDVENKYDVKVEDWAKREAYTGGHNNLPHIHGIGGSAAAKLVNAGIDPSLEFRYIDKSVYKKFAHYFEPDGIKQCWPFVQSNYKLCKLITKRKDDRLPSEVQSQVKQLLRTIEYTRDKSKFTAEAFRRVSHVLMRYELKSILSNRDRLWRIP